MCSSDLNIWLNLTLNTWSSLNLYEPSWTSFTSPLRDNFIFVFGYHRSCNSWIWTATQNYSEAIVITSHLAAIGTNKMISNVFDRVSSPFSPLGLLIRLTVLAQAMSWPYLRIIHPILYRVFVRVVHTLQCVIRTNGILCILPNHLISSNVKSKGIVTSWRPRDWPVWQEIPKSQPCCTEPPWR